MTRIKSFFYNNKFAFAAFVLPVLIMFIALIVQETYPFGDTQVAVIDMYHQYVPFLSELQYKLQHGGSLFYTWNGAGGCNFWCLVAYYGASPLNLLLALVPSKFVMEGITVILLIKIGLAGSFMYICLRDERRDNELIMLAFSTLYALSSYVMGYYWCIMWIDAVMLLPLVMMGLRKIIAGQGIALYTIALGLTVFSNYYISIMVCIFILFFYPVLYFTRPEGINKGCVKTTLKAVGCSLLGIGLAAIMLLPTYKAMQSTYYISSDMPEDMILYFHPLSIINQMLPSAHLTYRSGLPNLYCGMLVVILLVVYVLCKGIKSREKVIYGAFLVFIFFSININRLNFIWHGLHFPNELPYRYTFAVIFVLIFMAYRAFAYIDGIEVKSFYAILAVGIGYYVFAEKLLAEDLDNANIFVYSGLALLTIYIALFALYKNGKFGKKELSIMILAIVAAEMCCNTCTSLDLVGNSSKHTYSENVKSMRKLVEYTNTLGFARTESNSMITINEPARLHYKGISQFSSSLNAGTTGLMEAIGMEGEPGKNRFNYNLTDPVTDALMNVKYIISRNCGIDNANYKLIKKAGNSRLYESKYPLSIGYMTSPAVRTWGANEENPFVNLTEYMDLATGRDYDDLFISLGNPQVSSMCASAECTLDDYVDVYTEGGTKQASVDLSYVTPKAGNCYICIETSNADTIMVQRENDAKNTEIENDCNSIVNIGRFEEGESFKINVLYEEGLAGAITVHACIMDEELWDEAYGYLSADMLKVTDYDDTHLKGTIEVESEGLMVTSIPYDEGWTLYVDGEKKKVIERVGNAWMATALSPGTHEIEFKFRPPGFILGLIISILSIMLLAALCIIGRIKRKPQDEPEAEDYDLQDEISPAATDEISSSGI
ncbi:MAG: YfhO family protein [Firmicutes bacterium]|nr:YfhO family protein [Bacillota bacterium]